MIDKEWENVKDEIIITKGYLYFILMIIKALPKSIYRTFKQVRFDMRIEKAIYKVFKNK